jgi:photosystem II stability/assembly factor-like uncharacterized protein
MPVADAVSVLSKDILMSLTLAITTMLVIQGTALAQTVTQIAPFPSRWGVNSAYFLDSQKGFACGGLKSFSRTLDGGRTWTRIPLPGDQAISMYNVTFLDADIGIATGNSAPGSQDIFRTTNGGQTWSSVSGFPIGGSWYHQKYVSATTGFIGCNGALVRTTNAGATWQLRAFYPDCPSFTGMDFIDANTGLGSGGRPSFESGVFKTTDGGTTWTLMLDIGTDDVVYLSPTVAVAATSSGIYRSTDAGETWAPTGAVVPTGMVDMDKLDATTIVGVSGKGDIWRTADGGFTWNLVWIGEGSLPSDWSGSIHQTLDGGLTWARVNKGANFWAYGLAALSSGKIVTAGQDGYVQTMWSNGQWDLFLLDPPFFGYASRFQAGSTIGSDFIYAVGQQGALFRSLDGGSTWQSLTGAIGRNLTVNDVKFTDRMNGWLTGWDFPGPGQSSRETFRTQDGGVTWQLVTSGNFPGIAIDVVGSQVWIQSGGRAHWRSTNSGATFAPVTLPYNSGSTPSVSDMSFADTNNGYASGYDGYLVRTLDGGASWTQVGSATINTHNNGVLAFGEELWVCGSRSGGGNAFIKRSLNRGQTWQSWAIGGQYSAPLHMVRTGTRLYAAGEGGEIWQMDGLPVRCPADMDDGTGAGTPDGGVTIDDLLYFLTAYANGVPRADLDNGTSTGTPDGGVTIDDLLYFLSRFDLGC